VTDKDEAKWEPFKAHTLGLPVSDEQLSEVHLATLFSKIMQGEREVQQRAAAKANTASNGHASKSKA